MPYLIDGHNLVPKIPGLTLETIDDEAQLIQMLVEYCRVHRRQVEVYFDNAPPGETHAQKFGQVTAHFVRKGKTADEAIRRRLKEIGKNAPNWTVVSSDHAVLASARQARAQAESSELFSAKLIETLRSQAGGQGSRKDELSPEEIQEWIRIFKNQKREE